MEFPVPEIARLRKLVLCLALPIAFAVAVGTASPTVAAIGPPTCPSGGNLYPADYPVVTGNATVGGVLNTTNGTWKDIGGNPASPFRYFYQWYSDGVAIAGATLQSYTVAAANGAHLVYAAVTANSGAGTCGLWGTANSNSVDINAESDEIGPMEEDQSAETGDESTSTPAAPMPMTPTGAAAAGTYSTELWTSDATETDDGLNVVAGCGNHSSDRHRRRRLDGNGHRERDRNDELHHPVLHRSCFHNHGRAGNVRIHEHARNDLQPHGLGARLRDLLDPQRSV